MTTGHRYRGSSDQTEIWKKTSYLEGKTIKKKTKLFLRKPCRWTDDDDDCWSLTPFQQFFSYSGQTHVILYQVWVIKSIAKYKAYLLYSGFKL